MENLKPTETYQDNVKRYKLKDESKIISSDIDFEFSTVESNLEPLISKSRNYRNLSKEDIKKFISNEKTKPINEQELQMLKSIYSFYSDNKMRKNKLESSIYHSDSEHILNRCCERLTIQQLIVLYSNEGWINSSIIAVMMEFFNRRQLFLRTRYNITKVIHFLDSLYWNSFDITNILPKVYSPELFTYKKNLFSVSFFDNCFKVFWPINMNNTHWALMMMDFIEKKCSYYDSIQSFADKYCNNIFFPCCKQFLKCHAEHHHGDDQNHYKENEWKFEVVINCPQQNDSFSCGVACILNADYLSDGLDLNYLKSNDFLYYRKRYVIHILKGMINYELISPWFEPLTEEESQFFLNDQNQTIYREIVGNYGWRSKAPHLYNFRNTNNKEKELFDFININLQITSTDNEEVKGDIYDIIYLIN
jgi:hypothetical protein